MLIVNCRNWSSSTISASLVTGHRMVPPASKTRTFYEELSPMNSSVRVPRVVKQVRVARLVGTCVQAAFLVRHLHAGRPSFWGRGVKCAGRASRKCVADRLRVVGLLGQVRSRRSCRANECRQDCQASAPALQATSPRQCSGTHLPHE